MSDKPVKSPCISVCLLNQDDLCVGCYRSGQEISRWGDYSDTEKREVLEHCRSRLAAAQTVRLK